jgi:hypothetical protein
MRYKIYPSVGIARVGNSASEFFVGPEIPGRPGIEIDAAGVETPVRLYKVSKDQIKRQGARFRVFEIPDDGSAPRPVSLAAGARVVWTVHLVNKKAAIVRPSDPPLTPRRPKLAPNSNALLIDPKEQVITGANAAAVKFDSGEFMTRRVPLGELRTDRDQNLIVLGGFGISSSPENKPLPSFYTNEGWHDDVSDGPVKAVIRLPDGTKIDNIEPAWVVTGPPDFAPGIQGIVTLYDILQQVATDPRFGVPPPATVSFTKHIFPLLQRTRNLRWINANPHWSDISDDWPNLADPSAATSQLRDANAAAVKDTSLVLDRWKLTKLQSSLLDRWAAGDFISDWTGIPQAEPDLSAEGLTRAAMESTVGQGFFPGIEGGIILTDPTLYATPFDFRIDHSSVRPGDITALMAQPWQADFYDCREMWWPSQRPDDVLPNPNASATALWARGAEGHIEMVNNFSKLAFVTAQKDSRGNIVFAEDQRAS